MSTFYAYTSPASGHLFPMVPGFLALQARGHTVHLRTDPKHVEAVRAAGLRDVEAVDPGSPRSQRRTTRSRARRSASRVGSRTS